MEIRALMVVYAVSAVILVVFGGCSVGGYIDYHGKTMKDHRTFSGKGK